VKCPAITSGSIIAGDSLELLKCIQSRSIDAIVTDPPYGLAINDSDWDTIGPGNEYQQWVGSWAVEANRVLKPGGFLISFASPRLYHRLASGVEDAGFKVKDLISWIHPKGFAMAMDAGMLIDKKACAEQLERDIGRKPTRTEFNAAWSTFREKNGEKLKRRKLHSGNAGLLDKYKESDRKKITIDMADPRTELAKKWAGFKTGLKPLNEPILLAQKETDGSIADNIKKWNVGAMNVNETRIPYQDAGDKERNTKNLSRFAPMQCNTFVATRAGMSTDKVTLKGNLEGDDRGRFPANVVTTEPMLGDHDKFFLVSKPEVPEKTANGVVDNPHPTTKPLRLMDHLVKLVTKRGDVVLDLFAGSGSTLVSAKRNCRGYIGIEKERKYVDIAVKRLENTGGCDG
jgi:site-specific DNA-methyltransferase (adenine-specific)